MITHYPSSPKALTERQTSRLPASEMQGALGPTRLDWVMLRLSPGDTLLVENAEIVGVTKRAPDWTEFRDLDGRDFAYDLNEAARPAYAVYGEKESL